MEPATRPAEPILRVELFLCPRAVTSIALLVAECAVARLQDADTGRRLHLAAFELVENAVKYSSVRWATVELQLEEGAERWVQLRVASEADPERLEEVRRRFRDLRSPSNPMDHYDRLIQEAAPRPHGVSGLGLARIRAEAGLDLDCAIEGRSLAISARGRVSSGATAPPAVATERSSAGHRGSDR